MAGATLPPKCKLCGENHRLGFCPKFLKKPKAALAAPRQAKPPTKQRGPGRNR